MASLCQAYGDLQTATEPVVNEGLIAESGKRGDKSRHPAVMICASARASILSISRELGLTPKAREAIGLDVDDDEDGNEADEFERFLAQKSRRGV